MISRAVVKSNRSMDRSISRSRWSKLTNSAEVISGCTRSGKLSSDWFPSAPSGLGSVSPARAWPLAAACPEIRCPMALCSTPGKKSRLDLGKPATRCRAARKISKPNAKREAGHQRTVPVLWTSARPDNAAAITQADFSQGTPAATQRRDLVSENWAPTDTSGRWTKLR